MLVCAMNPCKCGWYGDSSGRCTCSKSAVDAYLSRISGPLLDRIDMIVEVASVDFDNLRRRTPAEPSSEIKKRVDAARARQHARFAGSDTQCNARMTPAQMRAICILDEECTALMREAFDALGLTARSYDRILRVARTVADLDGSDQIQSHHLAEAIRYRSFKLGET
jgi:magnesium chelatase family protein